MEKLAITDNYIKMSEDREKFGEKIRQARKDKGFGLRQLARKIGIDYSGLSRIERGQRPPPDLDLVVKMAEELDIDRNPLLRLAGVPEEVIKDRGEREIENWIAGRVVGEVGKMSEIDAGQWTLHVVGELGQGKVFLGLRPEDITLFLTDKGFSGSSARNRIKGKVVGIEQCGNYNLAELDCGSFSLKVAITDTSLKKMELSPGKEVYATFKATAPVVKEFDEGKRA